MGVCVVLCCSIALLWKLSLPLREGFLRHEHSSGHQCGYQQVGSVDGHQGEPVVERQGCSCNLRQTWDHRCGSGDPIDNGWGLDPGPPKRICIRTCEESRYLVVQKASDIGTRTAILQDLGVCSCRLSPRNASGQGTAIGRRTPATKKGSWNTVSSHARLLNQGGVYFICSQRRRVS